MAYGCQDYEHDFPPVLFSTFRPLPQDKEDPASLSSSDTTLKNVAEPKSEAPKDKDKHGTSNNTPIIHMTLKPGTKQDEHGTSKNTPAKDIKVKPGVKLKEQTYQWFEKTQRKKLVNMGQFPEWFHGFVTRNRAEDMLQDKPLGCFLVRFCESHVGFVLSYRGVERCRHFVLNQRDDETYMIEGETSVHPQLEDLINYYCTYPVEPYKELLTTPCSKNSRKADSPGTSRSSPNSPTAGPMYGRIAKPSRGTLDAGTALATSPKDKTRQFPNVKLQVEHQSSLLGWKLPAFPEPNLSPSKEDPEDPLVDYTPFSKPSESPEEADDEENPIKDPTYASVDEFNTYTEPAQWGTPAGRNSDNGHEPIAFYAMGRGSRRGNLDNVYSEVDVHSMPSCGSKAAKSAHTNFSTLPTAINKTSYAQKPSAFHSSFRSNKMSGFPQEQIPITQGKPAKQASKLKTKQQIPVQFDDPSYGKTTVHHVNSSHSPLLDEQENIYERIPDNYPVKVKNIRPPKKAS